MKIPDQYKTIFITGGAGFIGSHIVDSLVEEGKNVFIFDNLSSGKKIFLQKSIHKKNCTLIEGDLLNPAEIAEAIPENTDLVFHLAANPDISKGIEDPTLDF